MPCHSFKIGWDFITGVDKAFGAVVLKQSFFNLLKSEFPVGGSLRWSTMVLNCQGYEVRLPGLHRSGRENALAGVDLFQSIVQFVPAVVWSLIPCYLYTVALYFTEIISYRVCGIFTHNNTISLFEICFLMHEETAPPPMGSPSMKRSCWHSSITFAKYLVGVGSIRLIQFSGVRWES